MDDQVIALKAREAATSWDWAELVRDGGNEAAEQVVEELVRDALAGRLRSELADEAADQPTPAATAEPTRELRAAAAQALYEEMNGLMPPGSYNWSRFADVALMATPRP